MKERQLKLLEYITLFTPEGSSQIDSITLLKNILEDLTELEKDQNEQIKRFYV